MKPTRIFPLGCEFLMPYLEPSGSITTEAREASLVLAANNTRESFLAELQEIRKLGKPVAWWTIEDPNWFDAFIDQARLADFVFTADEDCIPRYRERLGHARVFWLPLACSPQFHRVSEPAADAADFVISANWYANEARVWSVNTVVEPLRLSGRKLALYCYENFMWPEAYRPFWRGRTHYLSVAEQYTHGRVVLGVNNQRSGLDGRAHTVMTSMRTFEALACGKPFLAAHSDAYARLGLRHGEHMAAVRTSGETLEWADRMLGSEGRRIAEAGRAAVFEHHTYEHRLRTIIEAVLGSANGHVHTNSEEDQIMTPNEREETEQMESRLKSHRKPIAVETVRELAKESATGNMRYPELLALADALLARSWKAGEYVCEIGTFHGATGAFLGRLAAAAKLACRIVSVDSFESPYLVHLEEPSSEYYKTMAAHALFPHRNQVVRMRSSLAEPYLPAGIGLLLVDGGRGYEDCVADLESYTKKLAPGAFLAVDDVWYDSVRRATDDFCRVHSEYAREVALEKIEVYRKMD
jgi:spore maturation protein CgeB/predicted O-methyltransferase YrrM